MIHTKPNGNQVPTIDQKYIDDPQFKDVSATTESGDVAIIDMNVLHRSGYNTSKNKVKLSLQCLYHNASVEGFLPQYD